MTHKLKFLIKLLPKSQGCSYITEPIFLLVLPTMTVAGTLPPAAVAQSSARRDEASSSPATLTAYNRNLTC